MARMTDQSRSRKIIARLKGLDPVAIGGVWYKRPEDRGTRGDYQDAPEGNRADERDGFIKKMAMPGEAPRNAQKPTRGANPVPGMPGARG